MRSKSHSAPYGVGVVEAAGDTIANVEAIARFWEGLFVKERSRRTRCVESDVDGGRSSEEGVEVGVRVGS